MYHNKITKSLLCLGLIFSSGLVQAYAQESSEKDQTQSSDSIAAIPLTVGLEAYQETIASGQTAKFKLNLINNDTMVESNLSQLVITWSDHGTLVSDLDALALDGVVPTQSANTLTYNFKNMQAGFSGHVALAFATENGITENNERITVTAALKNEHVDETREASTKLESYPKFSTSNQYLGILKNDELKKENPSPNDDVVFNFKVDIPKPNFGLQFLQEGTQVSVTYELPAGFEYVKPYGNTPTEESVQGNTITWLIDTPTFEEQKQAEDHLLPIDLSIVAHIKNDVEVYTTQETSVVASAQFLSQQYRSNTATTEVMISPNNTSNPGPLPNGTIVIPEHGSPIDGYGRNDFTGVNEDPKVYENSILSFPFIVRTGWANHLTTPLEILTVDYTIDEHLTLTEFRSEAFYYATYYGSPYLPLTDDVNMELYGSTDGIQYELLDANFGELDCFVFSEQQSKTLKHLRLNYTKAPAGFYSIYNVVTAPEKGYLGQVENNIQYDIKGVNTDNNMTHTVLKHDGNYDAIGDVFYPDPYTLVANRTAQIIEAPKGDTKVMRARIDFLNTDPNYRVIEPGAQTLNVQLMTDDVSLETIEGPFEAIVNLPKGITYTGNDPSIVLERLNDGREQLHITINKDLIKRNDPASVLIPVNVAKETMPDIYFDLYVPIADDIEIPSSAGNIDTEYMERTQDLNDINGNGNTDEMMIHTSIGYYLSINSILKARQYVVQDGLSQRMITTQPDATVEFAIELEHDTTKLLQNFILINTLPSTHTEGLYNGNITPSTFNGTLQGPIKLPKQWDKIATVSYSEDETPYIKGVVDANTHYPVGVPHIQDTGNDDTLWIEESQVTDFSKMKSFKIEVKDTRAWLDSESAIIRFEVKLPNTHDINLTDTNLAFNDVIFAANHNVPAHPLQAGVKLSLDSQVMIQYIDEDGNTLLPSENQMLEEDTEQTFEAKKIPNYSWKESKINDKVVDLDTITLHGDKITPRYTVQFIYKKNETPSVPEKPIDKKPEPEINNPEIKNPENKDPETTGTTPQKQPNKQKEEITHSSELPATGVSIHPLGDLLVLAGITVLVIKKRNKH